MQYSIATAISTILAASTLTAAAVIPSQSGLTDISLLLRTGDGDATVGRSVVGSDLGFLLKQDSTGQALTGVAFGMNTPGATCGIFDPTTGASINGLTFNSVGADALFGKNSAAGEANFVLSDAVTVAICCDATANFAKSCAKPQPKSTGGNDAGSDAAPPMSTPPASTASSTASAVATATATATAKVNAKTTAAPTSNGKFFPVEMLLTGLSELAVPATVIADGTAQSVLNAVGIQSIHITKQHQPVQCQAFSDEEGKKPVGNVFNVQKSDKVFVDFADQQGVDISSIACKPISA